MKRFRSTAVVALTALLLAGCVATTSSFRAPVVTRTFSEPLGQQLLVSTGDSMLVEGRYIPGEVISLDKTYDLFLPGALGIPFPVRIEADSLKLSRITADWRWYCARENMAAASFPGLGSVVRSGDCIGIRIGTDGLTKEWFVDNSNYNRRETVWILRVDAETSSQLRPVEIGVPFDVETLKTLTFDGYHSGQVHFTWTEATSSNKSQQKFTFDYKPGSSVKVGIKGRVFEILSVDNISLRYQWVKS